MPDQPEFKRFESCLTNPEKVSYSAQMAEKTEVLNLIRSAAAKRQLFLSHAVQQMARPERMITTGEVRSVVEGGEIIEEYPGDPRGRSFLMLGYGEGGRPVHVVCSPKKDYLAIITAYLPDAREWSHDYRVRKTT